MMRSRETTFSLFLVTVAATAAFAGGTDEVIGGVMTSGGGWATASNQARELYGVIGQPIIDIAAETELPYNLIQGGLLHAADSNWDVELLQYENMDPGIPGYPTPDLEIYNDGSRYLRTTTPTVRVHGTEGRNILVFARFAGKGNFQRLTLQTPSIGSAGYRDLTFGSNECQRLPDETVVDIMVAWSGPEGRNPWLSKVFGGVLVDASGPRNLIALAPSADFHAISDLAETNLADDDMIAFYASDAYDGLTPQEDIQYKVNIFDISSPDEPLSNSVFSTQFLPLDQYGIAASGDSAALVLQKKLLRGKFPTNVIPYGVDSYNFSPGARGSGQYLWNVQAKDHAGNISTSTKAEIWVPRAGQSLLLNLYSDYPSNDDSISRIRIAQWMPIDTYFNDFNPYSPAQVVPILFQGRSVWINEVSYNAGVSGLPDGIELGFAVPAGKTITAPSTSVDIYDPAYDPLPGWAIRRRAICIGNATCGAAGDVKIPELLVTGDGNNRAFVWIPIELPNENPVLQLQSISQGQSMTFVISFGGQFSRGTIVSVDQGITQSVPGASIQLTDAYGSPSGAGNSWVQSVPTILPGSRGPLPYCDGVQTEDQDTMSLPLLTEYERSYQSRSLIALSNEHRIRQKYAETVYKTAERWRLLLELFASSLSRQSQFPGGVLKHAYYPASLQRTLSPRYDKLFDSRLRFEVFRDRDWTEARMYSASIVPPTGLLDRRGAANRGEFLRRNVLIESADFGGVSWRWSGFGMPKYDRNQLMNGTFAITDYPDVEKLNRSGMPHERGQGIFSRLDGVGGICSANSSRLAFLPSPRQAYLRPPGAYANAGFSSVSKEWFSAGQRNLNAFSRQTLGTGRRSGSPLEIDTGAMYDEDPIFPFVAKSESGEDILMDGKIRTAQPIPRIDGGIKHPEEIGVNQLFNWGYGSGERLGHTFHEFGHAIGLWHSGYLSPGSGLSSIMTSVQEGAVGSIGLWQLQGIPSAMGASFVNPLLGVAEIDGEAVKPTERQPAVAVLRGPSINKAAVAQWDPLNLLLASRNPVFNAAPSGPSRPFYKGPATRIGWPREMTCAQIENGMDNFPPIIQTLDERSLSSGDSVAGAGIFYDSFRSFKYRQEFIDMGPVLFAVHSLKDIGVDGRVELLQGDSTLWAQSTSERGSIGENGQNFTAFFYETPNNIASLTYVYPVTQGQVGAYVSAANTQAFMAKYTGSLQRPYPGVDAAILSEKTRGSKKARFVLLPASRVSPNTPDLDPSSVFYTTGIRSSSITSSSSPISWTILGGGSLANAVVMRKLTSSPVTTLLLHDNSGDFAVGNMVIEGSAPTGGETGLSVETVYSPLIVANCIFKNLDTAIRIGDVQTTVKIDNNSILSCNKGIWVEGVDAARMAEVMGNQTGRPRYDIYSSVASNIVVDWTSFAIKIGDGGNSALAWSPFPRAFDTPAEGNALIPVRENMVYRRGCDPACAAAAFQGDQWYADDYGPYDARGSSVLAFSEYWGDPQLGADATPGAPARGIGHPLRMDVMLVPNGGTSVFRGMRRSVGAVPSPLASDYTIDLAEVTP